MPLKYDPKKAAEKQEAKDRVDDDGNLKACESWP